MTKSKYWRLVRIDAAGNRKILEIAPAKAFFARAFNEFPYYSDVPSDDIQQQLLILVILRSRVIELAKNYSIPENLTTLEHEITLALNEQITNLISQAETEAQSAKNNPISHFTERLCKQLKIDNL